MKHEIVSNYWHDFVPNYFPEITAGLFCSQLFDANQKLRLLISARELPWDTKVLGRKCGRIDTVYASQNVSTSELHRQLNLVLEAMDSAQIEFCDFRVSSRHQPLIQMMGELGFGIVDRLNIYLSTESPQDEGDYPVATEPISSASDLGQIAALAASAFGHSRLYRDPKIPKPSADHFYHQLAHSITTKSENLVGVSRSSTDGEILGFYVGSTVELPSKSPALGCLWTIAVNLKSSGNSIGISLLLKFLQEMHKRVQWVEIGTQIDNLPANSLYTKLALPIVAEVTTMHRWN